MAHLRMRRTDIFLSDERKNFYTASTGDIDKLPARQHTDDYYYMELDAHMEGMTFGNGFFTAQIKVYSGANRKQSGYDDRILCVKSCQMNNSGSLVGK